MGCYELVQTPTLVVRLRRGPGQCLAEPSARPRQPAGAVKCSQPEQQAAEERNRGRLWNWGGWQASDIERIGAGSVGTADAVDVDVTELAAREISESLSQCPVVENRIRDVFAIAEYDGIRSSG